MNGTETPIGEAVGLAVAARAALDRGDLAAARADARAAAAMLREHAGAGSADVANVLVLQADAERLLGELAAAEGSARAAAAIMSRWPAGQQGSWTGSGCRPHWRWAWCWSRAGSTQRP